MVLWCLKCRIIWFSLIINRGSSVNAFESGRRRLLIMANRWRILLLKESVEKLIQYIIIDGMNSVFNRVREMSFWFIWRILMSRSQRLLSAKCLRFLSIKKLSHTLNARCYFKVVKMNKSLLYLRQLTPKMPWLCS